MRSTFLLCEVEFTLQIQSRWYKTWMPTLLALFNSEVLFIKMEVSWSDLVNKTTDHLSGRSTMDGPSGKKPSDNYLYSTPLKQDVVGRWTYKTSGLDLYVKCHK